ncbi:MAG TPA: hypothetical protein VHD35_18535, partial [Chitinophagaceae bacterium]|nr:hypothetical protein [Chitinophagaceae bacterium]
NVEMSYTFYSADEKVFSITVSTEYKLSKPKFIVENDEIVERSCLAHLIQLSWNHLRGIQATLIKNTPLEGYYAPVISPSKILKDLTPSEFASE